MTQKDIIAYTGVWCFVPIKQDVAFQGQNDREPLVCGLGILTPLNGKATL